MCDAAGGEAALDDRFSEAPLFYGAYGAVVLVGACIVLIPGAPLLEILFLTQALNAVLLLPLLWFMRGVAADSRIMGAQALTRRGRAVVTAATILVAACVGLLGVLQLT